MWKHVGRGDDSGRAIAAALSAKDARALVEDAKLAAPKLREMAKAGGRDWVEIAMAKLALTLDPASRRQGAGSHEAYRVEEYVEALAGFPPEAIIRGATDYRDTPGTRFFPTIGELITHIKPRADRIHAAAYRAARIAEAEAVARRAPEDAETRAAVAGETAAWLAKMGSKSAAAFAPTKPGAVRVGAPPPPPKATMRPTHGELAQGSALTPEMRELMSRQSAEFAERMEAERRKDEEARRGRSFDEVASEIDRRRAWEVQHPVDALVEIAEAAGYDDQLDPAALEEARAICDEVVGPGESRQILTEFDEPVALPW